MHKIPQKGNIVLPIFICASVAAVLAFTGYLFYNSSKTSNIGIVEPENKVSQQTDPYSNWKNFTSEANQFSFRYPPNWDISEAQGKVLLTPQDFLSGKSGKSPDISITISKTDPTEKWDPRDFIDYKKEEYQLGNILAQKITGVNSQKGVRDFAIVAKVKDMYVIVWSNESEIALKDMDNILNTFKYMGPTEIDIGSNSFSSNNLGITFNYAAKTPDNDYPIEVFEEGNKAYVHVKSKSSTNYTDGQWVEVFKKDRSETLEQAVQKKFLTDYSKSDCQIVISKVPNFEIAQIKAPVSEGDNLEEMTVKSEKCPKTYTTINGLSYFLMDPKHPDKFVYFSIGQYGIPSGEGQQTWQDTIKFL